ncbi:MAG: SUMF1/EgtB/PvdO family nonheme iron enzyme, partial [Chloroflexota bacterium]
MDASFITGDNIKVLVETLLPVFAAGIFTGAIQRTGEMMVEGGMDGLGKLWHLIRDRMSKKEESQEALEDFLEDPNKKAFIKYFQEELKSILLNDPELVAKITLLLPQAQKEINEIHASSSGIAAQKIKADIISTGKKSKIIKADKYVEQEIHHHHGKKKPQDDQHNLRRLFLEEMQVRSNDLAGIDLKLRHTVDAPIHLSDVYTDLDTTEMEDVRKEEEYRDYLRQVHKEKRISAKQMLDTYPRLLILGDPGSGKSTFLKHVTYLLATAGLTEKPQTTLERLNPWNHGLLTPLHLELRDLVDFLKKYKGKPEDALSMYILDFIRADHVLKPTLPWIEEILRYKKEQLLILLDGLDEVPNEYRQQVVTLVTAFTKHNMESRYVVTSRPYAYLDQPWRLENYRQVTLSPLSDDQIFGYIDNLYDQLIIRGNKLEKDGKLESEGLKQAVQRDDIRGLAERPLLLTIMAYMNAEGSGRLPEDRTDLYALAVDWLLRRWEERRGGEEGLIKTLDVPDIKRVDDLKEAFYTVAYNAHESCDLDDITANIPKEMLLKWLSPFLNKNYGKAEQFVDYIRERAGLLIRHKTDAYTFPHRTFQEFLAACYLYTRGAEYPDLAASLARQPGEKWREVYTLAVGYATRQQAPDRALAAVNALLPNEIGEKKEDWDDDFSFAALAGEALLEMRLTNVFRQNQGGKVLERVRAWLVKILEEGLLTTKERVRAGNTLASLGDPRFNPNFYFLPYADNLGFIHIPAGPFLMGSDKTKDSRSSGDEQPQHSVTLKDYWIAKYPVTVAQWISFVKDSNHKPENDTSLTGVLNHPVRYITWHEALKYCTWLSEKLRESNQTPVPLRTLFREQKARVLLPSEAEWEKAARGVDGRIYPWEGNFDPQKANTSETGIGTTSTVGCFPQGASTFRILDMSGNVWEWTRSLWGKDYSKPDYKYPYSE